MKNFGIVYIMQNIVNKKIYIGQTREFYGEKKFGLEGRFDAHIKDAFGTQNKCKKLNNSIRKYGRENFTLRELLRCPLDKLDYWEKECIADFRSQNDIIGYNITEGGRGVVGINITHDMRINMSNGKKKTRIVEPHIHAIKRKGILVGYGARWMDKCISKEKWFSSTKNTPEKNLQLTKEWLKNWSENKVDNTTHHNRESNLPNNIIIKKDNNDNIIGYTAVFKNNKISYSKCFMSSKLTLEEKLEKAKEWVKKYNEGKIDLSKDKNFNNPNAPKNMYPKYSRSNKELIGYQIQLKKDGIRYNKSFCDPDISLEDNYDNALEYRKEILNTK